MRRHLKPDDTEAALANFSLTFAKALLVFCVVLFLLISPKAEQEGIKPNLQLLISMDWPGDIDCDVDIWVRDPDGKLVYYNAREIGFLTLERDDLGLRSSEIEVNGERVRAPGPHQELVSIRGTKAGNYVVNAYVFGCADEKRRLSPGSEEIFPIPVTMKITRVNPAVRTQFERTLPMNRIHGETHFTRFTMLPSGELVDLTHDLPVMIHR